MQVRQNHNQVRQCIIILYCNSGLGSSRDNGDKDTEVILRVLRVAVAVRDKRVQKKEVQKGRLMWVEVRLRVKQD